MLEPPKHHPLARTPPADDAPPRRPPILAAWPPLSHIPPLSPYGGFSSLRVLCRGRAVACGGCLRLGEAHPPSHAQPARHGNGGGSLERLAAAVGVHCVCSPQAIRSARGFDPRVRRYPPRIATEAILGNLPPHGPGAAMAATTAATAATAATATAATVATAVVSCGRGRARVGAERRQQQQHSSSSTAAAHQQQQRRGAPPRMC